MTISDAMLRDMKRACWNYGKTWRCWREKPTKEERAKNAWSKKEE